MQDEMFTAERCLIAVALSLGDTEHGMGETTQQEETTSYRTVQYSAEQHCTARCCAMQFSAVLCGTIQRIAEQNNAIQCSTVQYKTFTAHYD